MYQLNQTFLQSESDYQISLQTKQTKINNLTQQTRNLETVVLGSFIAFGILLFIFLVTCIRNATKTSKEKLISKSVKRAVVTKKVLHDTRIRADVKNANERHENNVETRETDVGLDAVQAMIDNYLKPSFMVQTQDANYKH